MTEPIAKFLRRRHASKLVCLTKECMDVRNTDTEVSQMLCAAHTLTVYCMWVEYHYARAKVRGAIVPFGNIAAGAYVHNKFLVSMETLSHLWTKHVPFPTLTRLCQQCVQKLLDLRHLLSASKVMSSGDGTWLGTSVGHAVGTEVAKETAKQALGLSVVPLLGVVVEKTFQEVRGDGRNLLLNVKSLEQMMSECVDHPEYPSAYITEGTVWNVTEEMLTQWLTHSPAPTTAACATGEKAASAAASATSTPSAMQT